MKCYRDVPLNETSRDEMIIVKGDQVVEIKERLLHNGCGGTVLTLRPVLPSVR